MPMIKCPECGKEISDLANACPNCGCPIMSSNFQATNTQEIKPYIPEKQKMSVLGIVALVFSFLGKFAIIGLVLAVIDLRKDDDTKKTCSKIAIGVSIVMLLLVLLIKIGSSVDSTTSTTQTSTSQQVISEQDTTAESNNVTESNIEENTVDKTTYTEVDETEEEETEEVSKSTTGNDVVYVGDSFENNDLRVTINSADLDFTDYDDTYGWYTPNSGDKYIMVSVTFENNSDYDKYVSLYDFDCYADNATCEQKYGLDDNDFINTNLSSGRNVSFKIYFEVPKDAQSIELEYETNSWSDKKVIVVLQ
jgi:ABC-type multidrug transport system fused ATPase/permease subunit